MVDKDYSLERRLTYDGVVHHPLGGGSYVFQRNYVEYLARNISKQNLRISIGAQPNSSPHFGTLVVFNLAYALGKKISRGTIKPEIFFEIIDTAPSESVEIGGIDYQISLRYSNVANSCLGDYFELLDLLNSFSGISYTSRKQRDFNSEPEIPKILKNIVQNRDLIAPIIDPQNGLLRMRVACSDCGLTDKKGINTKYYDDRIESYCPEHKWFETYFEGESEKFEYNTPLRNLIRGIVYTRDNQNKEVPFEWLRVTGSDYAGYYQEQLLYKTASLLGISAHELPTIVYAPLVVDWSGAKLSKSLYLKQNAYKNLPQYLVNYKKFRDELGEKGAKKMFEEVSLWLEEPYRLFRDYSVYYFLEIFKND
ncbi:MAG: hypothetical protein QT02_C0002G0009 [archaeon GW2011_AR9]|nr:MAG: hypothetical protein QT02_C0002G0009 [archaeon GW2011_AR9]MBS3120552.1 hypothetical protein [Candidatus Woesearchaeota archaeon]HIG93920.1 hypothetical protein [Candidatus Woesearchaeota archaeon]HIH13476.1 hypothetical protein [Candidatus Woesearchaeota archaeon]